MLEREVIDDVNAMRTLDLAVPKPSVQECLWQLTAAR
jgi:hypothetical protein